VTERRAVARLWAGFALLGAGLVHLAVVREHLAESLPHGLFFAVTGAGQVLWAVAAMSRVTVPAPRAAVVVHLGLVALWVLSRTAGLPLPPDAWTPEPAGRSDVLAVCLELVAVAAVTVAVRRGAAPVRAPGRLLAGAAAGALTVGALTTPALAATEAGGHAHRHGISAGQH
jgi:hypothetical protein